MSFPDGSCGAPRPRRTRSRAATSTTTAGSSSTLRARTTPSRRATRATTTTATPTTSRWSRSSGSGAYRFSLEWSRIEPEEGEFSRAALDHYRRVLATCHEHGLTPMLTFHHFTSPRWIAAAGGWEDARTAERFARFCERAMRHLGDLVPYACTLNEPNLGRLLHEVFGIPHPRGSAGWAPRRRRSGRRRAARRVPALREPAGHRGHAERPPAGGRGDQGRAAGDAGRRDGRALGMAGGAGRGRGAGSGCAGPPRTCSSRASRATSSACRTTPCNRIGPDGPVELRPGGRAHADGLPVPARGARARDPARGRRDRAAGPRDRERHRHRRRRAALRLHRRRAARRRGVPAPTASTCAATSTGRSSTTSSGRSATARRSGSSPSIATTQVRTVEAERAPLRRDRARERPPGRIILACRRSSTRSGTRRWCGCGSARPPTAPSCG